MNKVFPLKWYRQHDRSMWGAGPWDGELEDREQWSDPQTGYPCLAIRCDLGIWAGYVGVEPFHPTFGKEIEELPGVNWWGPTDEHHFIEPWPEDQNSVVDEADPKGSILSTVRMPDYLWFFGFDFAHAGDLIPAVVGCPGIPKVARANLEHQGTYKDLAHVKKTCAEVALILWGYAKLDLTDKIVETGSRQRQLVS